jgi:outer membrane protein assembly factor BamB
VTALIDLGELPRQARRDDEGPARPRRRTPAVAAVTTAALIVLAGAAPVPPSVAEAVVPAARQDVIVHAGARYLVIDRTAAAVNYDVAAYRLPDGAPLWRRLVPRDAVGWLTPTRTGVQMLTVTGGDATVPVEAGTSRVRYRSGAVMVGLLPSRNTLLWTSRGGEFGIGAGDRRLHGSDASTGAYLWSYEVPAGAWLWWDPAGPGLSAAAVLLPNGMVEVRDLERGGALTAAAHLLPARAVDQPPPAPQLTEELLLVATPEGVTAYGRQRLDRRWAAGIDLAGEYVESCGALLCVGRPEGGVRALDAATGETLWASDRWSFLDVAGDVLIAGPAGGPGGGGLALVEPTTGEVLADLGRWSPVWPVTTRSPVVIRHVLRRDVAWLGRIDTVAGAVRVFGQITGVTEECRAGEDFVACRRRDGSLGVWTVPLR